MDILKHLDVAREAHQLTLEVYRLTEHFPSHERFGLTSQLRRAVVSVGSNLAEGSSRRSDAAFAHHIDIALGSAGEVEYQLVVARDLGYVDAQPLEATVELVQRVRRMLYGLLRRVRQRADSR